MENRQSRVMATAKVAVVAQIPEPANQQARDKRIFDLWMQCYTQEEIAERENITKETVSQICQKMATLPESDKPAANHLNDFDPPIYMIGARIKPMFEDEAKARQAHGQTAPDKTLVANLPEASKRSRDDAAKSVNVSPRSVENASKVHRYRKIKNNAIEPIREMVKVGDISVAAGFERGEALRRTRMGCAVNLSACWVARPFWLH